MWSQGQKKAQVRYEKTGGSCKSAIINEIQVTSEIKFLTLTKISNCMHTFYDFFDMYCMFQFLHMNPVCSYIQYGSEWICYLNWKFLPIVTERAKLQRIYTREPKLTTCNKSNQTTYWHSTKCHLFRLVTSPDITLKKMFNIQLGLYFSIVSKYWNHQCIDTEVHLGSLHRIMFAQTYGWTWVKFNAISTLWWDIHVMNWGVTSFSAIVQLCRTLYIQMFLSAMYL